MSKIKVIDMFSDYPIRAIPVHNGDRFVAEIQIADDHWETCMINSMQPRLFDSPRAALEWARNTVKLMRESRNDR